MARRGHKADVVPFKAKTRSKSQFKDEDVPNADLVKSFRADVDAHAEQVDPEDHPQDWYSISLGFALGKGLNPKQAHRFAVYIRYHTRMG